MFLPNLPQGFGLEMLLIVVTGYLWVQSLKNRKTASLSAFFHLCSALLLFLLINIPVRFSDLQLVRWNPDLVFLLNAVYIALETLTAYEWFIYFLTVQGTSLLRRRGFHIWCLLPLALMIILLAVSYRTHWLFYVDENGMYTRGSLFFLQFVLPYSYLAASLINALIIYKKDRNRRLFVIFSFAFFSSMAASVLQIFFSGSFTHAGLFLAVLLLYIEMYQYEIRQMDQMKAFGEVNKQLAAANEKLSETIQELEISIANEKKANNAKSEFLSIMSHDIRTPLNGILGIIEINESHSDDAELVAANRKKAKAAAHHLNTLINDVLDMSKLSSGEFMLSHDVFVMPQLINEVITISAPLAQKAGIKLINENETDAYSCPAAYGSPLHISRILLNIIGNSIKYNKQGGSVTIRMSHSCTDDAQIIYTITVADTGIGMSEEYIQKLFEPFSQEHVDARSVYNGSGLGMAITKALIEKMQGSIHVKSRVGEGSVFTITLPFELAPEETNDTGLTTEGENLNGVRILLVEDNELNTEIAATLLEDKGAVVDTAENGSIAFDKFLNAQEGTYDVILMDCMMPVLNGFEATRAIRSLERTDAKRVPIIAMTANAFDDDVKKCIDAGMNDHHAKPIQIDKLIRTIRKYTSVCHPAP